MTTFPSSCQESLIDSPLLNVALAFDMEDHVQPVMFPFEVSPAPMQLKILQALGNMIQLSKTCTFDQEQKMVFRSALDRARVVAANHALSAKIMPHLGVAKPSSDRVLEPREGTEHSRTSFASRRKLSFSRQDAPQVNSEMEVLRLPKM
eukprot:TRINITY_DN26168_c0_g1_i1.p1 TRINITY_DN26168_c0_g1~~TRINITY_DN26168_c0_g1_i1.p1  ORF type:complete len:157 (+),score=25.10 TRINITY_DN26168_c0_g1_i1:26-472(+)